MYKYKYCKDCIELENFLVIANQHNYEIITMTEDSQYGYTVIYKVNTVIY